MFKTRLIYIKIRKDHIEATDLKSGQTFSERAIKPFSGVRNVVSNFNNANETIASVLLNFGLRGSFFQDRLKVLIHQLEGLEGGLSDIEKRALRDLAEMVGANKVQILEQSQPASIDFALAILNSK